ncbi:hypothetical protein HY230_07605 [Candidatus Acetothermia bacterium]|nr:hypothetical protein [Candidatus Acetothermia bacterium]
MLRKFMPLALIVWFVHVFSAIFTAAPISGSLSAELVIAPDCNRVVSLGPVLQAKFCNSVSKPFVKFETDLNLTILISGLEITSTSVLTFKGLELEEVQVRGTIGALASKTRLVFAPNPTEIQFIRNTASLSTRYCVDFQNSDVSTVLTSFEACPIPDASLYYIFEDLGVFHPIVQKLAMAFASDGAGAYNGPIHLVNQTVELNLNIGGLSIGARALLNDFETAQDPHFSMGVLFSVEGMIDSGIILRAETYVGAHEGLECYAECTTLERSYGGKVIPGFIVQEEKIFIRNLVIAAIINNVRAEFAFIDGNITQPDFSFLEWNQRFRLPPLNLAISNTVRFDGTLQTRFDSLITEYKTGNLIATAVFYFYMGSTKTFELQQIELIGSIEPPGVAITSDLLVCVGRLTSILCTHGVLEHDIYLSGAVGNLRFGTKLIFNGLLSSFSGAWIDITYSLVWGVDVATHYVIGSSMLEACSVEMKWQF